ncbi:MAG: hypothetical protein MSA07_03140 [Mucispirillum sp.]|nr:hypothetical protein [Mucispirillum sp.]
MHKLLFVFLLNLIFINTLYAQTFHINDSNYNECDYSLRSMIKDYDLSKLSDEEKLNKLLEYLKIINGKYSLEGNSLVNIDDKAVCYKYLDLYRESLKSALDNIKDKNIRNSEKYIIALFLYDFSKSGLYDFNKMKEYAGKISGISLDNFRKILKYDDKAEYNIYNNFINDIYKLINFINQYGSKLNAEEFIDKLLSENLYTAASFKAGRFDLFNMKNDVFTAVVKEGSAGYRNIDTSFQEIDEAVLKKYLSYYSKKYQLLSSEEKEYYLEGLKEALYKLSSSMYKLYILPLMGNVYIVEVSSMSPKFYNVLFYTIDSLDRYNQETYLFINNMESNKENNFPYGELDKLKAENLEEISEEEVMKNASKSEFIVNGSLDKDAYSKYLLNYLSRTHGWMLLPDKYYKFDINNDGRKELLAYMEITDSESGTYIVILDEDTLEITNNKLNMILINFMGVESNIQDILKDPYYIEKLPDDNVKIETSKTDRAGVRNFYQKLYTYKGKNKIVLVDKGISGIFIDVLDNKNKLDILAGNLYTSKNKINNVWKGSLKNGQPDNLLSIMPSFDINKASTASECAIVNDINLRMLDNLSSYKYFQSVENVDDNTKKKLLNKRREMNKEIKNCNGDYKCIRDILYNDVFIKN